MDTQNQPTQTPQPEAGRPLDETPPPPMAAPQPVKKDGSNKLLMVTIGVILLGLGLLGGYMIAGNQNKTEDISPTLAPQSPKGDVGSPTPQISPTSSAKKTKTVKAGLTDSQAFKPYSIEVPDGWTDARENTQAAGIDKLTLSKNGYTLTIYQAAMGGGGCTYKDEPEQQMAQAFTDFAEIKGATETFRRSWNQNAAKTISYTVCYKGEDNSYGTISSYGAISAASPNPADAATLAEIDSMISSLMKQ